MANLSNINNKFIVTDGGHVSIGATTTTYPLTVESGGVGTVLRAGTSFVSIDSVGSAASPSLIFNGDSNTGIFRAAADTLAFSTAGVERLRIDSSGLVKLPTTGINDTRHIIFTGTQGTANNAGNLGMWGNEVRLTGNWYYNGAQQKVVAGNGMGVMGIGVGTTDAACYLTFGVNGPSATGGPTERMRISSSGNVGIGFSPGHDAITKLELPGSLTNSSLKVGTVETQSYSVNNAWIADNVYYDGSFKLRSAGYASQIYFGVSNGGADISFKRYPTGNAGDVVTAVTSLQLLGDGDVFIPGNVGIGTASPGSSRLTVSDGATGYTTTALMQVRKNTANGNDTTSKAGILLGNNSNAFEIAYGGTTDRLRFIDGGGVETLTIKNGGNVGIGTILPQNDKLHVETDTSTVYNGNSNQTGGLFVNNIYHEALNTFSQIRLGVSGASGASNVRLVGIEPSQAASDFAIVLRNGSVWGEKLRIKGVTGNVGIGTDSPGVKLEVNGSTRIGGNNYGHQTVFASKAAAGNNVGVDVMFVGHTHSLDVNVMVVLDGAQAAVGRGYALSAYGYATATLTQTRVSGNMVGVSMIYVNSGGSENYVLRITPTYAGSSNPTIYLTVNGQSNSIVRTAV